MEDKANKILIIDDEQIILESCTQILSGGNYQIATAPNGMIGLEMLEEYQPDLIFVDLKMPGLSGFEVLHKVYEFDPTIVTVVITGFATVGSAVEAMKEGAFDFLPKPFTPDELRVITRRGLEKRNLVLETIALRREREMMRDHFAAIVSHELKSPLGAVQQNLIALAEDLADKLSEDQQRRLERSQARIGDLMKLIHTWLRVISSDLDEIRENFQPLTVPTLIEKAVESVETHATRKAIEIHTQVQEPISLVYGDEGTLVESLINIIGNAVKYSRLDSQINVKAEQVQNEILISVTDTGVGIAEEDLPRIFDDFYTGQSAPKDARGSGLGLALTRRIVEVHKGKISVESELGVGSTFVVHLPTVDEYVQNDTSSSP